MVAMNTENSGEGCQHHRVDNETWQCVECGTRMLSQQRDAETVLSAPNAAGCNNPHGYYIPDRGREVTVILGYKMTYECDRCHTNGDTVFASRDYTIWGCGMVHRGDYIPARGSVDVP